MLSGTTVTLVVPNQMADWQSIEGIHSSSETSGTDLANNKLAVLQCKLPG